MRRIYTIILTILITGSLSAQVPQKMFSKADSGFTSASLTNLNSAYKVGIPLVLSRQVNCVHALPYITEYQSFPVISTYGNIIFVTGKPIFLKYTPVTLISKAGTIWYGITDIHKFNWATLCYGPALLKDETYNYLTVNNPWLTNTKWNYDTFWTALIRNVYLSVSHHNNSINDPPH